MLVFFFSKVTFILLKFMSLVGVAEQKGLKTTHVHTQRNISVLFVPPVFHISFSLVLFSLPLCLVLLFLSHSICLHYFMLADAGQSYMFSQSLSHTHTHTHIIMYISDAQIYIYTHVKRYIYIYITPIFCCCYFWKKLVVNSQACSKQFCVGFISVWFDGDLYTVTVSHFDDLFILGIFWVCVECGLTFFCFSGPGQASWGYWQLKSWIQCAIRIVSSRHLVPSHSLPSFNMILHAVLPECISVHVIIVKSSVCLNCCCHLWLKLSLECGELCSWAALHLVFSEV